MLEFIAEYWLQFVLGLISTGLVVFFKRYIKLSKEESLKNQKEQFESLLTDIKEDNKNTVKSFDKKYKELENKYNSFSAQVNESLQQAKAESKSDDEALRRQMAGMSLESDTLRAGLLSIQGREFRENCSKLLESDHELTLDEYEEISADYDAYKKLGGNHNGDRLFSLVKKKFESEIMK